MRPFRFILCLAGMTAALVAFAQDGHDAHAHGHEAHAAAKQSPVPEKRWVVNAPLQTGMGKIRTAMESLAHHEMGHLDKKQVVTLAAEVDAQVQYLIANCNLDPKADAALHGIIGPLLAGAKALRDDPQEAAPVAMMRAALNDYPRYFDDPDWLPLAD